MLLEVSHLSVARGGTRILDDVSFGLPAGAAALLRGPNGIGKTTLLRTLAGLQPALSGSVNAPPESIAYAGHLDGVKATLTVRENLTFWASVFGAGDVTDAIARFALTDLHDRPAGQLSAGQKRRLGLSRLAVTGRAIWLMDEPTVSLDAQATALLEAEIARHLKAGGAVLIATHLDLLTGDASTIDLAQFAASQSVADAFDEAFL